MSINSRAKGNSYELQIINKFKERGWVDCVSSRSESKRTDDAGVDICYLPVNVQCKAVEKLGSLHAVLTKMPKGGDNVVFHKKNRQGTIVAMSEELFFKLFDTHYPLDKPENL